jgi:hypothetical protein
MFFGPPFIFRSVVLALFSSPQSDSGGIQAAFAGAERVFEILDEVPERTDAPDAWPRGLLPQTAHESVQGTGSDGTYSVDIIS